MEAEGLKITNAHPGCTSVFVHTPFPTPGCPPSVPTPSLSDTPAAAAKSLQSCPTLCDPIDGSPPGSPIPGILQVRTLEWVAISISNAWKVKSESEVAQSCPTLSDPMDCSLPSSFIHGLFQARVLEWVPLPSLILYSYSHFKTQILPPLRSLPHHQYPCVPLLHTLKPLTIHNAHRASSTGCLVKVIVLWDV